MKQGFLFSLVISLLGFYGCCHCRGDEPSFSSSELALLPSFGNDGDTIHFTSTRGIVYFHIVRKTNSKSSHSSDFCQCASHLTIFASWQELMYSPDTIPGKYITRENLIYSVTKRGNAFSSALKFSSVDVSQPDTTLPSLTVQGIAYQNVMVKDLDTTTSTDSLKTYRIYYTGKEGLVKYLRSKRDTVERLP